MKGMLKIRNEKSEMGRDRTKCVRLRLLPAILSITIVITACGGSRSTYSEGIAGAPAALEEFSYDDAVCDTGASYGGGVAVSNSAKLASYEYETAEAPAEEAVSGEGYVTASGGQEAAAEPESSRKLIRTVNISAETEDFDALVPSLQNQVKTLGGYIESISVYDVGSYYVEEREVKQRCANLTARVPKEKLDGFLAQVGEQTNVTSRSESVEDVTLQYVDLESHKKVLLTEQERLLELMGQAENVEDIIAIEGRLSEVRYQLESMESQLRIYDNQIDYSTVYLTVQEVRKYSAPQTATVWQRIESGFVKSLEDIGFGIRDFAISFVIDIPYIVLWIVLIVLAVLVWHILRKVWKKRRAKRAAAHGDKVFKLLQGMGKVKFRCPVTIRREDNEAVEGETMAEEPETDADIEQEEMKTDRETDK